MLTFDGFAFFEEGSDVPLPVEVFEVMQAASYESFIQDYVWNVTSPSPFKDTSSVSFTASL
jgi:hypothetical protein